MEQETINSLATLALLVWNFIQQRWISKEKKKVGKPKDLFKPKRVG